MKKQLYTLLLILSCSVSAIASHIVGAELLYDYLGNNQFKITLKLYRNCSTSCTQCAPYGDPEYVQIFDSLGNYIDSVPMPIPTIDPIPNLITNPCLTPVDVCITQAFYTGTYTLPPKPGGYTLVYERCCRNSAIQSIPTQSGSVYVTHISNDRYASNSSPRFTNRPPLFICADSYFQFDNSATDPDGDSLSYSLVNALDYNNASTCVNPSPSSSPGCPTSAYPPPYNSVAYLAPYSATNPLNNPSSTGNLVIDPTTGLLSGIPNQTGFFVVAVAVSEFRNGHYIGQTIRDYQFNIVVCNIPAATIPFLPGTFNPGLGIGAYYLNCTSRTVNFNGASFTNPPPTNIPLVYHWDFGVTTSTSDTSSMEFPVFMYPDTGTYIVTVITNKLGGDTNCQAKAKAYIKIYPILEAHFTFLDHCQDSAYVFGDGSFSTTSPLSSWYWKFGDNDTSTQRNPTHHYAAGNNYVVTLTVGNSQGCTNTIKDTVHVKPKPAPNFSTSPLCVGDSITFQYSGTGTVSNYYWDFNNGNTSTQQSPSTQYTTVGTKNVMLVAVTFDGCRDTITKPVVVHPLPVITHSPNITICPFTTTQLNATGGTGYAWSPAATLSNATISNPVASPTVATTYHVTVTDANSCTASDSVVVSLHPVPLIDAGLDTSVCLNPGSFRDTVRLTATGGVSYIWTPAAGLSSTTVANPLSRPAVNTTYYVTGTDANGCKLTDSVIVYVLDPSLNLIVDTTKPICAHDTTTLNVLKQGNSSYFWTPNIGISNPNSNSPLFFPLTTTTYYFSVQNYCYSKRDTAIILVHQLPIVVTEKLDSVCIGDTDTLLVQGAATYQWSADPTLSNLTIPNPIASSTVTDRYYVVGTDTFGCKNRDSLLLYVFPLPTPEVKPDTAYICLGRSVQLLGLGGIDYVWKPNPTLTPLNVANPIATPTDTTWYYVRIFNIHQCHADDSIKINVQLPVKAVAQSPYDVCQGSAIQLHASGGFYYVWTPGIWLNDSLVANPVSTPHSSIVYRVKVSNDCFSDTATVAITIRPLPTVEAGNDTTIYRNTPAILDGTSNGKSFSWNPSQYVVSAFSLTTQAYPLHTTHYILYAISEYGCVNRDTMTVNVEVKTVILLPTAFSPNGDGLNDVFRISRTLNIEKIAEFAVYDRWGEKVFVTDNIAEGWDGTYHGRPMDMEVYVYYVRAITYDGDEFFQKGNVTLVR